MHSMLIVTFIVIGLTIINPFIYGSDTTKAATTEHELLNENSDSQEIDTSADEEEAKEEEDEANN